MGSSSKKAHTLWVEKYRSSNLNSYVGNENIKKTIQQYLNQNEHQPQIFYPYYLPTPLLIYIVYLKIPLLDPNSVSPREKPAHWPQSFTEFFTMTTRKRLIFTLLYDSGSFMLSRNFRLQKIFQILQILIFSTLDKKMKLKIQLQNKKKIWMI